MRYTFDWDPVKANQNLRNHRISFESSSEVMVDPQAVSIPDDEHSEEEERWVTLGRDRSGRLLAIVHTFVEVSLSECKIRMISARKATKREIKQYLDYHHEKRV